MGLGEEPDNEHLEFRHSFNTLRADILDDSCEILMINYIKNHLNKTDYPLYLRVNYHSYTHQQLSLNN